MDDGIPADPAALFARWHAEAVERGDAVGAITLATADAEGRPSARAVILKGFGGAGFAFVTDARSRKAAELRARPRAAAVCGWPRSERQVRIEGGVEAVEDETVERWWRERPRASQVASIVAEQSAPLADRAALERAYAEALERLPAEPPRPAHFVGLRIVPDRYEFWQEGAGRLHHRLCYRHDHAGWEVTHLAP